MSMSMRSTAAAPLSALASSSSSSSLRLLLFPSSLSTGPLDTATWPELRARDVSPAPPPFYVSIFSSLLLESLSRFTFHLHFALFLFYFLSFPLFLWHVFCVKNNKLNKIHNRFVCKSQLLLLLLLLWRWLRGDNF